MRIITLRRSFRHPYVSGNVPPGGTFVSSSLPSPSAAGYHRISTISAEFVEPQERSKFGTMNATGIDIHRSCR